MKRSIKTMSVICAAAFCGAILPGPKARAEFAPISGSITFGADDVIVNNAVLANATSFYVDGAAVPGGAPVENTAYVGETPEGAYAAVPSLTSVAFNGFTFNPPVDSITPLWTFSYDGLTYSYDATSVAATFNAGDDEWVMGGTGMAMITGYTTTPGTWTLDLNQTGASFAFDATSGTSGSAPLGIEAVSDGGSGFVFLGGSLLALGAFRRRFRCS